MKGTKNYTIFCVVCQGFVFEAELHPHFSAHTSKHNYTTLSGCAKTKLFECQNKNNRDQKPGCFLFK